MGKQKKKNTKTDEDKNEHMQERARLVCIVFSNLTTQIYKKNQAYMFAKIVVTLELSCEAKEKSTSEF